MVKLGGEEIEVNEEGYLVNPDDWNEAVAKDLAKQIDLELTDKHFEVLNWLREQNDKGVEMTIRKIGRSGLVDIKGFYDLFPGGPLKNASKIAGLGRPTSCV